MLINTELLKTFLAAASEESFRAAASARFVTVSAISQQIKTLETQLGVELFQRVGRRVVLTDEGRALAASVRPAFGAIDDAVEAAIRGRGAVEGLVRLGTPRAFGRYWLRARLGAFLDAHPDVSVRFELELPSVLERRLSEGNLDLAILVRAPELATLASERLTTERFDAVASPAYLARWGTPRTVEDFRAHRWAIFDPDLAMHGPWWRATFGRKSALPPRIVAEAPSVEMLLELALAGVCIVVLPDYLVEPHVRDRALRVVSPPAKSRADSTLYLAWRRGSVASARVSALHEALRE